MACEQNNISDLAVLIREKDIEICGESVGGSEYIYDGQRYELQVPGIYQIYNSATAAATAHVLMRLGYELTEDDIRRGLKATFWKEDSRSLWTNLSCMWMAHTIREAGEHLDRT